MLSFSLWPLTPERKDRLQWVGPVACLDTNLYARKGSGIEIGTLEEAKKVKKIATATEYYTEQALKKEGFTNLESCANEEIAVRKLLNGEVELFPSSNTVMPALLKTVGATMDDVENVFTMSTDLLYIAFSKGTSPALVARWQEKLDEMKRDGTFKKIYKKMASRRDCARDYSAYDRGIPTGDLYEGWKSLRLRHGYRPGKSLPARISRTPSA